MSDDQMSTTLVKFTKIRSSMDATFWAKFAELKIDKFKLDEKTNIHLWGSYSLSSLNEGKAIPLLLDCTSFNENVEITSHNTGVVSYGYMVNTNTYDTFRQINPEQFIDTMGKSMIDSIKDGTALEEPWRLTLFLMIAHSDLKKYRFHYWVAHPTPFCLPEIYHAHPTKLGKEEFTAHQLDKIHSNFLELNCRHRNFFGVIVSGKDDCNIVNLSEAVKHVNENKGDLKATCDIYFAFYDPCANTEPGWPLRNLLCLLFWHCSTYCFTKNIKILSVRYHKVPTVTVLSLKTKEYKNWEEVRSKIFQSSLVGWELNANNRMGPNIADLSNVIDPAKLSERAIHLNLKLMKWRLVPDLELEKISGLKCLLLGAGTLGCSVARALIGWGVHNITFVDSSTVSHSNTVRQSLYTHQDAVERRFKADAAKNALLNIRPSMNAQGIVLQIPMPGHVVGPSLLEATKEATKKLEELIEDNDVVFLLLDSREARWLPSLLCAAKHKIAINAALGFDSYTVQRHGTRNSSGACSPDLIAHNPSGKDLGCYFCNDVTQPGNSQTDRTLDQQCTVSRPGLSQIASGLAVELMVAITQHPEGIEAKAFVTDSTDELRARKETELFGLLGGIPHSIRGTLWNHSMQLTITHRFPCCTACSIPLINEYRKLGFAFVLQACNTPNYLEKLSGLEELLQRTDLDELCYALDSSSEDEDQLKDVN